MAVFRRRQFSAEKGICHMPENTITELSYPSGFGSDPFTDVLRDGARKLIEQAIHRRVPISPRDCLAKVDLKALPCITALGTSHALISAGSNVAVQEPAAS